MKKDYFARAEKEEQNILYRQTLTQKKEVYFVDKIKDKILSSIRNLRDLPEYANWNGIQNYDFVVNLSKKYPQYEFLTQINDHIDYLVSTCGNVLSYQTGIWTVLELKIQNGYLNIGFGKNENGDEKTIRVHIVTIEAFMPVKLDVDFEVVNHRDGTRHNNYISNVEATTHFYNSYHAIYITGHKNNIPVTRTDENGNVKEYKTINETVIKNQLKRYQFDKHMNEKGYYEFICKEVDELNAFKYKFEYANKLTNVDQSIIIEDNSLFEGEWFLPFTSIKIALKGENLSNEEIDEEIDEEILTEDKNKEAEKNIKKEIFYMELFYDMYEISNYARIRNKTTKNFYKQDQSGGYPRISVLSVCKTRKKIPVHKIMGATFLKYDRNGEEIDYISKELIINHINPKLFDNKGLHSNVVTNLEWRTLRQNMQLVHSNKSIKVINLDDGTCAWFRCTNDCYKLLGFANPSSVVEVALLGTGSRNLIPTLHGVHVRYCTTDEYLNNWKNSRDIRLKFSSKRSTIEVSNVTGRNDKTFIYESVNACATDCITAGLCRYSFSHFGVYLKKIEKIQKTNPFTCEIQGSRGKCTLKVTRDDGLIRREKILTNNQNVEDEYNEFVGASHIGNVN